MDKQRIKTSAIAFVSSLVLFFVASSLITYLYNLKYSQNDVTAPAVVDIPALQWPSLNVSNDKTPNYLYRAEVRRILDGDTISVNVSLGFGVWLRDQKLRLYGINAPETYCVKKDSAEYARGKLATAFVESTIPDGSNIVIESIEDKADKYGRWLAIIWYVDGKTNTWVSLNTTLLEKGLVSVYSE